jgi:hypothetical protein
VPPQVTESVAVRPSKQGTTYTIPFTVLMVPLSANNAGFYRVLQGVTRVVKRHRPTVYNKPLKIVGAAYDPGTDSVRLAVAEAHKGPVQITVRLHTEAHEVV